MKLIAYLRATDFFLLRIGKIVKSHKDMAPAKIKMIPSKPNLTLRNKYSVLRCRYSKMKPKMMRKIEMAVDFFMFSNFISWLFLTQITQVETS